MLSAHINNENIEVFRKEILKDIQRILNSKETNVQGKELLNSVETINLLGLSESKLKQLESSGELTIIKTGQEVYYKFDDILDLIRKSNLANKLTNGANKRT